MKIAQVVSTFPPYEGGMGNVCYNISKKLFELGHEVTVFLPIKKDIYSRKANEQFKIKYLKPIFFVGNASFLPSLSKELAGFDIIHLHYPFFGGDIFVRRAAIKNKIPYVITYHQDVYGGSLFKKMIFKIYNCLFQRLIMLDAKKVLALSKDHIDNSKVSYLNKIPGKITIVPNGINLEDYVKQENITDIRKKFNIEKKIPIITFIGALDKAHYFKRLDILLKAIQSLNIRAHLLIIGDGDLRQGYIKLADDLGISKQVTFVGKLNNLNAIQYLKQVDLLILPSTDTESFGIVLIEAMACAKPVVVTNLPGVRAVVQDKINGLLFEKGNVSDLINKMNLLLDNYKFAINLGKNGRKIVEAKYTWDAIVKKLENIYLECINH